MRYNNFHEHSHYSNPSTPDCIITPEDLAKRAVELGHTSLCTVEHGYAGNVFEYYDVATKYGLKLIFGVEFYYVNDRFEKDKANTHLIILAKNEEGKREITKLISESWKTGFYYKNRIDKQLVLNLNPENVFVTSACVGSYIGKCDDYEENFILPFLNHFNSNFMLEIHDNTHPVQVAYNQRLLEIHTKYNIPLIHATDTHYIKPEDSKFRDMFLRGKGIWYPDEDGFVLDYPDSDSIFRSYETQGIFTREQVEQSLQNTLLLDGFEDIKMDKFTIKMPSIYPDLSHEQKMEKLKDIINEEWKKDRKEIPKKRHEEYKEAIKSETKIIENTKIEDYFLLNYELIKKAKEKGAVLTRTGRGSAPSYYLNKLFGFTEIDRLDAPITLYPTRFISTSRILETKSLPDIDFNWGDREGAIEASKEILGEDNVYFMTAYGTMQESEAFRNYCRALNLNMDEYNEVGKDLDSYRDHPKWGKIIEESSVFIDVIDSISPHPCFSSDALVMTDNGYKKISDIKIGDYVLTHKNRFKKVIKTMKHKTQEKLFSINTMGVKDLIATGNHPFFIKESVDSKPIWKEVQNLKKGDYIGIPINKNENLPIYKGIKKYKNKYSYEIVNTLPLDNPNFWWFVGFYMGDGWTREIKNRGTYEVCVCIDSPKEEQIVTSKINGLFKYWITREKTCDRLHIASLELLRYLQQFGNRALNKRLTKDVLDLPINLLKSFLEGFFQSDCHVKDNKIIMTSVSKELLYGIQACIHKVYKCHSGNFNIKKAGKAIIQGREVNQNERYSLTFSTSNNTKHYFNCEEYIWIPFRNKKMIDFDDYVYNLEVEEDNSYSVFNMVVHNCAFLLLDKPISEEIGVIRTGDGKKKPYVYCALIDSDTSDAWKYLKNDLLLVTVWKIINEGFKAIGQPIPNIRELTKLVENDEKVWELYEKGLTATLNQAGTDNGTPQIMQYKPKNIRELSAWVSAIRPAFESMKRIFLNRESFSYGIPEFDAILQESDNFILFQENIMATLVYAGFSEDVTYGLLKAIAKKKEGIIEPIRDKFIQGFIEKTGSVENAERVWKIIEDAVGYGFNSSHAYSVALDSVYGAYLKANHPLEYYTVVLNIYENDKETTAKIMKELPYFKIKVLPIKFGLSQAHYSFNKEQNAIYKGLKSIAYLNERISEELHELAKNNYEDFIDLLVDIKENTSVDSRQMKILIRFDFFEQFGKVEDLLIIFNEFLESKIKYDKKHKEATKVKRIIALKEFAKTAKGDPIPVLDRLLFEKEHTGSITTTYPKVDESTVIIMDINKRYTPRLTAYKLQTGEEITFKVDKKKFFTNDDQLLNVGDIIRIKRMSQKQKNKQVNGVWVKLDETEDFLESCKIVRRYQKP